MIILTLIITFLFSLILTNFIRKLAIKKNIIDIPNIRSSHSVPTPRGGGLAFFLVWLIILFIFYLRELIELHLLIALISVIPIGLISMFDDLKSLSPKTRLFVQLICSVLAVYFIGGIKLIDLGFISFSNVMVLGIIAIIGLIWFTNLFNFLDGIDAYASVEAIFVALSLFIFTKNILLLFLISAVAGFLIWNWPKAKVFMGDIGSTMLGFTLFIFSVHFNNENSLNILYWLSLTSLFWFDASITLIRRKINGEKISQPHKKHAYQRIVQYGFSHRKTVIYSIFINLLHLGFVFINISFLPSTPFLAILFSLVLNSIIYWKVEQLKSF